MKTITPDSSIFKNEDALRDHYPERILERDDKLEEYLTALKPVIRNKRPQNIFVHGPTGTGKTIATKATFEGIHQSIEQHDYDTSDFDEPSVRTIHVEVRDLNTSYQVVARLINELRSDTQRGKIRQTGYPESEMYGMLYDEIELIDESHLLIAIDEVDTVSNKDTLLYKLPRINDDSSPPFIDPDDTKVGIVGITNDQKFKDYLDSRTQSTLFEHSIYFPPYDAQQLQTILADRASVAFHDGALSDDAIPLTSAFAAQRKGHARTGLELLLAAGQIVEKMGDECMTEKHVRKAEEGIQKGPIATEVEGLSLTPKLVAYSMVRLEEDDETPAKLDKIYGRYETYAKSIDADTVTPRTVHETLNDLMVNSVVTSHEVNKGSKGGRHYEYELAASVDAVVMGLSGDTRLKEIEWDGRI